MRVIQPALAPVLNVLSSVGCKMAGVFDIELHDEDTGQLDDSDDDAIEVEEVSVPVLVGISPS